MWGLVDATHCSTSPSSSLWCEGELRGRWWWRWRRWKTRGHPCWRHQTLFQRGGGLAYSNSSAVENLEISFLWIVDGSSSLMWTAGSFWETVGNRCPRHSTDCLNCAQTLMRINFFNHDTTSATCLPAQVLQYVCSVSESDTRSLTLLELNVTSNPLPSRVSFPTAAGVLSSRRYVRINFAPVSTSSAPHSRYGTSRVHEEEMSPEHIIQSASGWFLFILVGNWTWFIKPHSETVRQQRYGKNKRSRSDE